MKSLPDHLPSRKVVVGMDYLPQSAWWIAQILDPQDWIWQGRGQTAEAACDLAHEAACKHFKEKVVTIYRYTKAGIEQSKIEDLSDPSFLECEICNPPE